MNRSALQLLMIAAMGVGSMSCATRADDPARDLLRIEEEWAQASLKNDAELSDDDLLDVFKKEPDRRRDTP